MGGREAQEYVMHLISATSSQLLYAVVNSAYLSERDYDEMHHHWSRGMADAWLI